MGRSPTMPSRTSPSLQASTPEALLLEAGHRVDVVGRRPGGPGSSAGLVEQLQQVVRGELDLLVPPLRGAVDAGDQSRSGAPGGSRRRRRRSGPWSRRSPPRSARGARRRTPPRSGSPGRRSAPRRRAARRPSRCRGRTAGCGSAARRGRRHRGSRCSWPRRPSCPTSTGCVTSRTAQAGKTCESHPSGSRETPNDSRRRVSMSQADLRRLPRDPDELRASEPPDRVTALSAEPPGAAAGARPGRAAQARPAGATRPPSPELYDATAARAFGLAVRVVRDPAQAEEVTQEAFLEIWRTASRFDADEGQRSLVDPHAGPPQVGGPGPLGGGQHAPRHDVPPGQRNGGPRLDRGGRTGLDGSTKGQAGDGAR